MIMNEEETKTYLENVARSWPGGKVVELKLSWQEQHILGEGAKHYVVVADRPYNGQMVSEHVTGRIVRKNQQ